MSARLKAKERIEMIKPTSLALMPKPFDWIDIPGGKGTIKTSEEDLILDIPKQTYWIAKYPVTNQQYNQFVEAGGYRNDRWWSNHGIKARKKYDWVKPRFWDDENFSGDDKPVVGVSWYEAIAFCLWLSDVTDEQITLPTEAQWQYAAQGTDGRNYPWGNEMQGHECRNYCILEDGIEYTSPVIYYEGIGDSPFAVVDMAGNVDEWCLTNPDNKAHEFGSIYAKRVACGGSWTDDNVYHFRCNSHFGERSSGCHDSLGFRIARL